jgi:proteasome activator subunit 4
MLAILAEPLSARRIWKFGGLYVPDIFALLIPGIDLNDPSKTGLSCMAISNMVDLIHLSDISEIDETDVPSHARALRKAPRIPVQDDQNELVQLDVDDLSTSEVAARMRFATSTFRDWVPEFIGRILLLFGNLPEEGGKTGKTGGKTEQLTLMSVLVRPLFPTNDVADP